MIAGELRHNGAHIEPRVLASIQLLGISTSWVGIDFILDTGAGWSCLHPNDAFLAGVSPAVLASLDQWPERVTLQGIGGLQTYYVAPVRYAFRHHDGRTQYIDDRIHVAPRTPLNAGLPSLLGWDVLSRFGILAAWSSRRLELHPLHALRSPFAPEE